MGPIRIGVIGCGNISGIYLENLSKFRHSEVVAVTDLDRAKAQKVASEHGVSVVQSPEEFFANPDIEIVLNLTIPGVHADVDRAAIAAGKHVYAEKPLAIDWESGKRVWDEAQASGVHLGSAPDTFMGAGLQTSIAVIDSGLIGRPVAAHAFMLSRGHESWHPNPFFYYEAGGGPLLDMGPYYLNALVAMLGPISAVNGSATISFKERHVTSEPHKGAVIKVATPTHIAGNLEFASGALANITMSFDVVGFPAPHIVIYGEEGTMIVPDPNMFSGEVKVCKLHGSDWEVIPPKHKFGANSRGVGVLDMGIAIRTGRPYRASGELALHVHEAMTSMLAAAEARTTKQLTTTCERPAAMPMNLERDDLEMA